MAAASQRAAWAPPQHSASPWDSQKFQQEDPSVCTCPSSQRAESAQCFCEVPQGKSVLGSRAAALGSCFQSPPWSSASPLRTLSRFNLLSSQRFSAPAFTFYLLKLKHGALLRLLLGVWFVKTLSLAHHSSWVNFPQTVVTLLPSWDLLAVRLHSSLPEIFAACRVSGPFSSKWFEGLSTSYCKLRFFFGIRQGKGCDRQRAEDRCSRQKNHMKLCRLQFKVIASLHYKEVQWKAWESNGKYTYVITFSYNFCK